MLFCVPLKAVNFLKAGHFKKYSPMCPHDVWYVRDVQSIFLWPGLHQKWHKASLAKFQGKRTFPCQCLPSFTAVNNSLLHGLVPCPHFEASVHVYKFWATCFLVRMGLMPQQEVETSLPFLIYLSVTDLHTGIISTGFMGLNWIRKLRWGKNHIKQQILILHGGFSSWGGSVVE